jgi:hypothetical protein
MSSALPGDDPDRDGMNNLGEFAFATDPLISGPAPTHIRSVESGGNSLFVLTLPIRTNAVFSGLTSVTSAPIDGITYRVEGSADLTDWNLAIAELTGPDAEAIQSELTPLSSEWTYRSFHLSQALQHAFLRAKAQTP